LSQLIDHIIFYSVLKQSFLYILLKISLQLTQKKKKMVLGFLSSTGFSYWED